MKPNIAIYQGAWFLPYDPTPSKEDREITAKIGLLLQVMGVALHDHIIIGTGYHSMADEGWLNKTMIRISNSFNSDLCI